MTGVGRTHDLRDAGPQLPAGAELGDGLELVVRGGEPELDLAESPGRGLAAAGQLAQVLESSGDGGTEFLGVGGPGIVECGAVDREGPHGLGAAGGGVGELDGLGDGDVGASREGAGQRGGPEMQPHGGALGDVGARIEQRVEGARGGGGVGAGVEGERREIEQDLVERGGQVGDRDAVRADTQPQGADAVLEGVEDALVHLAGSVTEAGADEPSGVDVADRGTATDEGEGAGQRRLGTFVAQAVEGRDGDVVVGGGLEQPLRFRSELRGVDAAGLGQHPRHRLLPLRVGARGILGF